ncbi:MAG: ABC transporter ATP-binding protein, partial [Candidatus Dormibacteraeota bacterium]|nr:ABC transporter ATP-binding protein [Candidatus Dormibacteraeota bacterium]
LTLAFRTRLFQHVQRLSLTFHDTRGISDSIFRIEYDAPSVRHLAQDASVPLISASVTLVSMMVVVARIDLQLAALAAAVTPPLYFLARYYNRRMRPRYLAVREVESRALKVVQETLTALRVVKAFGRQGDELRRFADRSGDGARARVRLTFSEGMFGLLVNGCTGLGTALVLFIGVQHVRAGILTLGSLLMVVSYLAQLYRPLTTIGDKFADAQASLAGVERTFELLDEEPEVIERPHAWRISRARGRLEFRDVHFAYDGGAEALKGVSLCLPAGSRLGVAGRTGAGKSTLVSLLLRFYDPNAGAVYLDGVDLRDYRLSNLRDQFAIVLQDTILFSTSIGENIRYARPDAPQSAVVEAARAANADEFIRALPEGYETLVGERGMRLSGGERQRIALARAFLKDAPVLILDEATSSVDVTTEAAIMDAMERLMEARTTVMIAHRLSTLESCDTRLVLDAGQVVRLRVDPERQGRAAGQPPPDLALPGPVSRRDVWSGTR